MATKYVAGAHASGALRGLALVLALASLAGCGPIFHPPGEGAASTGGTAPGSSTASASGAGSASGTTGSTGSASSTGSTGTAGSTSASTSSGPATASSTGSAASSTTGGFAILDFAAAAPVVPYGQPATLSWTLAGQPTALTLSDPSGRSALDVLGLGSTDVSPARRQTYLLTGTDGVTTDARLLTVAARGLDLVAGSPTGAPGSADGRGDQATFSVPTFGAVDAAGNLYVTDSSGQTVRKIDRDGVVTTVAGQAGQAGYADGPARSARFNYPTGIAVDAQGAIYVSEVVNETVRKISPDGTVSTLAGSPGQAGSADGQGAQARFNNPNALVVDAAGNLFLADTLNHAIRRIDPAGNVVTVAGSAATAGSADGHGTQAQLSGPNGLAIDAAGNLYVSDTFNSNIRRVDPQGNVTTVAGGPPGSADGPARSAGFNYPSCVAVAPSGDLYIADTNNFTVRRLDAQGMVSTVAGVAGRRGVQVGPLPGGLDNIYGLSVSPEGDLYVLSGNRVLQVTAP